VTFLFTDIEGSTRLWEHEPAAMRAALARHDAIVQRAIEAHGGYVFATGGDGSAAAFARPPDAIAAAESAQAKLHGEAWPDGAALRVRMGVHTGVVEERDGDYFGPAVNRAARIMAIGHGGQILCSSVTAGLLDGTELVDLGEHRLRDLSGPQRVFQAGAGAFPNVQSLEAFASNLPAQATAFVGRDVQLEEVAAALSASRLVTLTGVGGVGKTRLAIQAAADLLPHYRDGAWLVDLAPAVEPEALVEVVATALGVPERQGQPLSASVGDFLREKQLLLVLDNCEHLLDAVSSFVSGVIAHCPNVVVLATSREGLGVAGERILVVPSLGVPKEGSAPEVAGDTDAVRLFVERATEAKAGFELTVNNAMAVARLVRRLDGIPLAIELAAARVRSLTPAELAQRVDERFRLLAGGRRTAVERHQTLRRAIDWSYELLAQPEQATLNRTAVFATDFGLDAAEAVISGNGVDGLEVVDLLGHLVDKSLIVAEDRGEVTRYRLLETIRQYAQDRLEAAGEADAVRRRHGEYYAGFAASASVGLKGPDEAAWIERVEAELDHLRAAVAWSVASGELDLALRLVVPLGVPGTPVGDVTFAWAAPVAAMPGAEDHQLYPQVLAWAAWAEIMAGEFERAVRTGQAALDAAEALGIDDRAMCRVFAANGGIVGYVGDVEQMRYLGGRFVEAARRTGDDWELVQALSIAHVPLSYAGDVAAATELTDESLRVARRLGNPSALGYAAMSSGLARVNADPVAALPFFVEGLEAAESVGNQLGMASNLGGQAWIRIQRGEWREATPLVARCVQDARHVGNQQALATFAGMVALIVDGLGDGEAAAILYGTDLPFAGPVQEQIKASQASLRHRLGDDRFEECAGRGRAMGTDALAGFMTESLDGIMHDSG
jgi:predicted ATPase